MDEDLIIIDNMKFKPFIKKFDHLTMKNDLLY